MRDPRAGAARSAAPARLAWAACALVLVVIVAAVGLALLNRYELLLVDFLIPVASAALVGALIASRQPRNPVGWFILGHAAFFTLGEFGRQYAIYGSVTDPGALPLAHAMIWPTYWVWYPGLILMVSLLPLYFPDGRLLSPSWRPVAWLVVAFGVAATGLAMVRPGDNEAPGIPNPLGVESLGGGWALSPVLAIVLPAGWLLLGAVAVASLAARFRRSRGTERRQLEWFLYALVLFLAFNGTGQLLPRDLLPLLAREMLFVLTLEALWVAIGIAILKYRLYDIDLLINRTLVYGSLTVLLALLYFGGVTAAQAVLRPLAGGDSTLAVVASTLAIAALFNPLRRRTQGFIDRRFYRSKYDGRRTLEAFSATLRDETDLDALRGELVGAVRGTVQPAHVSLWLREQRRGTPDAPGSGAGAGR